MNMFLHGIDNARIEWGDTLRNPLLIENDRLMRFEVVVANPPFSLDKWGADVTPKDRFRRFHRGIPPKSKGDYAFIQHMIETTDLHKGPVGVIVPHGVLTRMASEGLVRQKLIEENLLDAVIGLPQNLFFGTPIPAAIIFAGNRPDETVIFIDASRDFEPSANQNKLNRVFINRVADTYRSRATIEHYSYVATCEEIVARNYTLNIPRYVNVFEEEIEIDIFHINQQIEGLDQQLSQVQRFTTIHARIE